MRKKKERWRESDLLRMLMPQISGVNIAQTGPNTLKCNSYVLLLLKQSIITATGFIRLTSIMSRQGSPQKTAPPMSAAQTQEQVEQTQSSSSDTEFTLVARLTQGLEDCDWDQLQEKYLEAMDEHCRVEDDLRAETARLLEVFNTWSQTTVLQDEKRALKRFKTQMQHVQHSEISLESKKKHYTDVVKAFQNALALLNEQMKA